MRSALSNWHRRPRGLATICSLQLPDWQCSRLSADCSQSCSLTSNSMAVGSVQPAVFKSTGGTCLAAQPRGSLLQLASEAQALRVTVPAAAAALAAALRRAAHATWYVLEYPRPGTRDASHGPGRGAAGGEAAAAFFQQSSRDRKDPAFPRRGARARTAHCQYSTITLWPQAYWCCAAALIKFSFLRQLFTSSCRVSGPWGLRLPVTRRRTGSSLGPRHQVIRRQRSRRVKYQDSAQVWLCRHSTRSANFFRNFHGSTRNR